MYSNQLIRVVIASGLIAAIGCADGQRSSNDRAGKGKKMFKVNDPSTNLVNGKPSKTASTTNDAQVEADVEHAESDLSLGSEITQFPSGSYRLVGSVTIYKLQDTNETLKALVSTTYGSDAKFTPDVRGSEAMGKFKGSADKGLNLAIPVTLMSDGRSTQPTDERLMNTQVKASSNKIEIIESIRAMTEADQSLQGLVIDKLIANGNDQSPDGKITAKRTLLQLNSPNETEIRVIVSVEEAATEGRVNKINRNIYLTFRRTGEALSDSTVPAKSAAGATPGNAQSQATPGQRQADATPREEGLDGQDGVTGATLDAAAAATTKTK